MIDRSKWQDLRKKINECKTEDDLDKLLDEIKADRVRRFRERYGDVEHSLIIPSSGVTCFNITRERAKSAVDRLERVKIGENNYLVTFIHDVPNGMLTFANAMAAYVYEEALPTGQRSWGDLCVRCKEQHVGDCLTVLFLMLRDQHKRSLEEPGCAIESKAEGSN